MKFGKAMRLLCLMVLCSLLLTSCTLFRRNKNENSPQEDNVEDTENTEDTNKEDEKDPSCVFNPESINASAQISTKNKAFGGEGGAKATYAYVTAEENTDETYGGAYVRVTSTALTTSNQWGDICITPAYSAAAYSEYTSIKVWVYLEANNNDTQVVQLLNQKYSQGIVKNVWTELTISMDDFLANGSNPFIGLNFSNNASWGIYGIRIGEITAVK